jgi:hypothetical protein
MTDYGDIEAQGALTMESTTHAFECPVLTTTERNALTAVNGMVIYNSTDNVHQARQNGAWVDLPDGGVFGEGYSYAESLSKSSTSSTTDSTKVSITTPTLVAGDYMIYATCIYQNSSASDDIVLTVTEDGNTVHTAQYNTAGQGTGGSSPVMAFMVFAEVTLTAGSIDIDLDYKAEAGTGTVTIQDARLQFWRVA